MSSGLRRLLGALALIWTMAGSAEAATVYTYGFSQDFNYTLGAGYIYPTKLVGGFTGTVDATGHISLATLTDFHLTFDFDSTFGTGLAYGSYAGLPDYFSFVPGDTSGSTLAFQSPLDLLLFTGGETACVGATVGFLCNGGSSRGVVLALGGVFARSEIAPVVTLVSSSAPAAVATTPVPGALLLFATALSGLAAIGLRRRRRA